MPDRLYQVWINDDDEWFRENAQNVLQSRFSGKLAVRTHKSYYDIMRTLEDGGYEIPSFSSPGVRRRYFRQREENPPPEVPPPDLVVQDYIFSPLYEAGPEYCIQSIQDITKHFPSARIVVSTTDEHFGDVQKIMDENGWSFPITGKVSSVNGNPVIEEIIEKDLKKLGYSLSEPYQG